ncbi:MAG: hypothetical protein IJV71_01930 [Lachnospiraceae bacterium]|nr:hypothetical protein [Lachnospiraceae bacterium]
MSDIRRYNRELNIEENDNVDEDVLEHQLKRHKRAKFTRVIAVVAVVLLVIGGYYLYLQNRTFTGYDVVETVDLEEGYTCRYYEFGDYILRFSEDGLAYLDGDKTHWNQAFEIKEPVIDICGDYVAIAEQKNNIIYMGNTKELQGKIETEYPIMDIDVSDNGVVAVISGDESEVSHIEILAKDGTKIAIGQTVLSGQGCPVDLSISQDGTKLVVSYLYVGNGAIQSKVVFYNYSEVGKNEVDRFVGGFDYDKTVMAKVEFLSNDVVAAYGDNKVAIYSMKQKPSLIAEIDIDKDIKSILYNSKYVGMVLDNEDAENPYELVIYDTKGKKVSSTPFNFSYNGIKFSDKSVVVYNDTSMRVYTVGGKLRYEGDIEGGISSIITKDKDYTYYIVGSTTIRDIKLK